MTAYGASEFPTVSPYFPDKLRNYGPLYQPTPHVLVVNYIYELPNLGQRMKFKALGLVTDHWSISGLTQWRSNLRVAAPAISFTGNTATNPLMNWTGSYASGNEAARMMVVANPQLPSSQVSFVGNTPLVQAPGANANGTPGNQILNESAFVIPYPCSFTPGATPQQGIGQSFSCFGNAGAHFLAQRLIMQEKLFQGGNRLVDCFLSPGKPKRRLLDQVADEACQLLPPVSDDRLSRLFQRLGQHADTMADAAVGLPNQLLQP